MMKHSWWWLPVLLGVPLGILAGGAACWLSPQFHLYADCRLNHLLTAQLAGQVNLFTLLIAGGIAALLLYVALARRCPPRIGTPLLFLLPIIMLSVAGALLPAPARRGLLQWLADPDVQRPALLLAALVLCAGMLWRLYRARRPAAPSSTPRTSRGRGTMRKLPWSLSAPFLLLLLAINLVAGWHLAATASSARRQPNIILVMVCSLRADHLGCYGYDLPTSPNLDRFARESTRFARAVAPSSWTLWSTASVLTARYPERIFRQNDYVAESDLYPGLPAALANRGYQTIAVTSHPLLHNDVNFHFSQDFHSFTKLGGQDFTDKIAPEVTVRALERVTRSRPFFLFVMYADTHEPYTQHPEFVFGPSRRDTLNPDWLTTLPPTVRHRGMEPAVERHRRELLAKYNSEIAHTDRAIGRLFDGLRERGLYDDTLIIICGDHGEEFLEHGHYGHTNTLYPEVTDVPLLIKHPRQREGRLVEGTFSLIDLYPSILAMLGAPSAHLGLHGEGVNVPTLLRPAEKPLFQATVNGVRSVTDQGQMYYRGTRFAITEEKPFDGGFTFFIGQATHHLYNLRADARAYHDHAAARPDILEALRAQMRRHDVLLDERDAAFHRRATSLFDTEKARERLKSLGYLQ